jgi:hypothetical protein
MFISGPRASSLGTEQGTTSCMLLAGQGGDHLTSSMIYHSSTVTCFHGNSYISSSGAACFNGNITGGSSIILSTTDGVLYGGTTSGSVSISNIGGQTYARFFGANHPTTPNATAFVNANSTMLTISNAGVACFASNVCASTISATAEFRLAASFARVATLDAGGGFGGGYNFNWNNASPIHDSTGTLSGYGYANDGSIRLYTRSSQAANTAASERMRILNTGVACFYCPVQVVVPESASNIVGFGIIGAVCSKSVFIGANCTYGYIQSHGSVPLYINELGNNVVINLNGGNTGIGISPVDELHANGNIISEGCFFSGSPDKLRIFAGHWATVSGNANCYLVLQAGGGNASFGTPSGWAGSATMYTSGVNRLTITSTGPAIFACSICLAGGNIFMPGAISNRGSMIEMPNSQTVDILGMPNLSSTFYLSYACNSLVFRNDSGGTMLQMYCNRTVDVGGNFNVGGGITAGGSLNGGPLTTTTQKIKNSAGGFANMVHKVQGAAGSFSQLVICVDLKGAGGYGYIINTGGTGGGIFQSGGGYTNGQTNFSHSVPVGSGFTVTCHACTGTENIIRFVGGGGVHPFASIQMFGSLQQDFDDTNIYIDYR